NHQPQLIDKIVLEECVQELEAAGDDDIAAYMLLQFRGLAHRVAREHPRVVPGGISECRGDNVLGLAVQPVLQGASPRWPPRGHDLVRASTQQHGLGLERLVERDLGCFFTSSITDATDPTAVPEALVAGRVLDDTVERHVFADDNLSHYVS